MKATITGFWSPDVEDLRTFIPEVADEFGLLLTIYAQPEGGEGEESFDLVVCSPRWLESRLQAGEIVVGRYKLITKVYSWRDIEEYLVGYVASCEGSTWDEVASLIGRIGKWEFEDYKE